MAFWSEKREARGGEGPETCEIRMSHASNLLLMDTTASERRRRSPRPDVVLRGPRWARALLFAVPGIWLGLLIGISLIEAPLKFTAPGITIPLGLGIGRRVFAAMNAVEVVLAVLLLVALWRACGKPRGQAGSSTSGAGRLWLGGIVAAATLAVKTLAIRPLLNQRTDLVLAGVDDGGSSWHYLYIAADGILIFTMLWLLVAATRALLPAEAGSGR